MKNLYRSKDNKIIAGVCGGVSAYFGVDPSLLRVIIAIVALTGQMTFFFIAAYAVCWIVIPLQR